MIDRDYVNNLAEKIIPIINTKIINKNIKNFDIIIMYLTIRSIKKIIEKNIKNDSNFIINNVINNIEWFERKINKHLIELKTIASSIRQNIEFNFFKNKYDACNAYVFNCKKKYINYMQWISKMHSFKKNRLKNTPEEAYPINDRPRGIKDIDSVNYWIQMIKNNNYIPPIIILNINNETHLVDGYHRLIATYILNKNNILAKIISS